jgi:hypothetical protein
VKKNMSETDTSKHDVIWSFVIIGILIFTLAILPALIPAQILILSIVFIAAIAIYAAIVLTNRFDENVRENVGVAGTVAAAFLLGILIIIWSSLDLILQILYIAAPIVIFAIGLLSLSRRWGQLEWTDTYIQSQLISGMLFLSIFLIIIAGSILLGIFVVTFVWTALVLIGLAVFCLIALYYTRFLIAGILVILFGLWMAYWLALALIPGVFPPEMILLPITDPLASTAFLGLTVAAWTFIIILVGWAIGIFLVYWQRDKKASVLRRRTMLLGP